MSVLRNMLRLGYFHCLIGTILSSSLDQIIDVSCYNRYNNGTSYSGNVRRTENGTPCIKWKNSNSTYSHFAEDHNFCRNPLPLSKEIERPWCYTDAQLKYGKCKIPACVLDCRNTISDLNYNGTIHTTRNGNTCQLWNKGFFYPSETANYCRTPLFDGDNGGGPWCYIRDGEWERCNIPVCGGSFCPDLSSHHLLTMDKKIKYQYGEIAIVASCKKGYLPIEKTYLKCTSTGTWNDTIPTCEEITCQPFILDNNVQASYQPDQNKHVFNSKVTLSCIPGYNGSDTVAVCKIDGQWSPKQNPRCTQITCQPFILENDVHGSIQPDLHKYIFNTRVTLSCMPGYTGQDTIRVCRANGQWSSLQAPRCTPLTCQALKQMPHQKLEPDQMVYSYRDNITFKCNGGYELTTEYTMVTCQSDGTWSNKQPNCTGVPCHHLPHIYKALLQNPPKEYRYPDALNVTCETGYVVESSNQLQCNSSRLWNSIPQFTCIEESLFYKDSMKKRGKCISYGLFGGILAAIVSISAGGHIATCFYYRKQAGKSAAVYEDMKFNTVERQITSNEDTYSELT